MTALTPRGWRLRAAQKKDYTGGQNTRRIRHNFLLAVLKLLYPIRIRRIRGNIGFKATLGLIRYARKHQKDGRLVGHIFTTWSQRRDDWSRFEPLAKGLNALGETNGESAR